MEDTDSGKAPACLKEEKENTGTHGLHYCPEYSPRNQRPSLLPRGPLKEPMVISTAQSTPQGTKGLHYFPEETQGTHGLHCCSEDPPPQGTHGLHYCLEKPRICL